MITENINLEQVKEIYNSSSKEFISEESNNIAIEDKNMKNYLYYEDNDNTKALGYVTVYEKSDFIQKEEFDVKIENINEDSVYIWEIGTRKGYEGKGIATKLLRFIIEKYKGHNIYTCLDEKNIPSIRIHEKVGFKKVKEFTGDFFEGDEHYIISILENK